MVHVGKLIETRLKSKGMNKSELARRLNLKSQAIHPILNKASINTEQLEKIGKVLEYDFFRHLVNRDMNEPASLAATTPADQPKARRSVQISLTIEDEEKQDRVLRLLGVSLK